jgi:Rod binding domain-containing protein
MSDFPTSFNPAMMPLGPANPRIQQLMDAGPAGVEAPVDMAQAARDFESVLLNQLMQEMSRTIPESGLVDSGTSKQIQSMFWSFLAEEVADNGGMGLWRDIQKYVTDPQQANPPKPTVEQEL